MTSLQGLLLIAAFCLVLHLALTTELLVDRHPGTPRFLRPLARPPELRRSRAGALVAFAFVIAVQLLMIVAVLQPDQVAGTAGAIIGAVELVLAVLWVIYLIPRRTQRIGYL
jgi:hypothetical protein